MIGPSGTNWLMIQFAARVIDNSSRAMASSSARFSSSS